MRLIYDKLMKMGVEKANAFIARVLIVCLGLGAVAVLLAFALLLSSCSKHETPVPVNIDGCINKRDITLTLSATGPGTHYQASYWLGSNPNPTSFSLPYTIKDAACDCDGGYMTSTYRLNFYSGSDTIPITAYVVVDGMDTIVNLSGMGNVMVELGGCY